MIERHGASRRESGERVTTSNWALELGYIENDSNKPDQTSSDKEQEQRKDDARQQEEIEREATNFVDSIKHELPKREALTKEQIANDEEELETL